MDNINFGDYLAKTLRVPNMLYTVVTFVPLAVPRIRRSLFRSRPHRQLLGVLYVNVLFAMWATVGYAEPLWFPTFHRTLAALTTTLYATESAIGDLTLVVSSTIVQVLRFPHRFQLILFALGPFLMALPLAWAIERATTWAAGPRVRRVDVRRDRVMVVLRLALTVAIGSVYFFPFLANEPYRDAYTSGDFDGFLKEYDVTALQDTKQALLGMPEGRTVVLPPTETSKLVMDADGDPHKFIDKFYIYYLDMPSYYYGLTGDKQNKFQFFLMLRGLYYEQDWWVNVARDIDLEYIVLNKHVEDNRGVGAEYLPELETYLRVQLEAVPDHVELVHENERFATFRLVAPPEQDRPVLLMATSWRDYLDTVFTRLSLSRCHDLQYLVDFEGTPEDDTVVRVLATDPDQAALDVWARDNEDTGVFFPASPKVFAFDQDIVASSYYLSPMFRLYLFFSDTKWNRTEVITPGIFGSLDGSFVGIPRATRVTVPTSVPTDGTYRVLARAAVTGNELVVRAEGTDLDRRLELRPEPGALQAFDVDEVYEEDRVEVDTTGMSVRRLEARYDDDLVPVNQRATYHDLGTVELAAGAHTVTIDKLDHNPMLFEGLLLVPEEEHRTMALPDRLELVEDVDDLPCTERSEVRAGRPDNVGAVENGPHADLTEEELLALIGVDLETAAPGGIGGAWLHLLFTLALVAASLAVVRWHVTHDPDRDRGPVDDD